MSIDPSRGRKPPAGTPDSSTCVRCDARLPQRGIFCQKCQDEIKAQIRQEKKK